MRVSRSGKYRSYGGRNVSTSAMFRCRRSAPARRRDACDFHAHEARASSCGSHFRMRQPAQGPNWNETTPCVMPLWRSPMAPLRPFEPGERWPRRCPLRGLSVMSRVGSMRRDSPYRLSRLALSAPKSSRARLSAAGPVKIATRQNTRPATTESRPCSSEPIPWPRGCSGQNEGGST